MLPKDLTHDIKARMKSIRGQIEGILRMLDEERDPNQILNQFKAADKALQKAQYLLLDEVYRKTLAIKIVDAVDACPGNCGNEERIEFIKNQFPDIELNDLAEKIKEMSQIKEKITKLNDVEKSNEQGS